MALPGEIPEWRTPSYGLGITNTDRGAQRGSLWATGDAEVDKYVSALDAALRGGRVGGARQMARDIEAAKRLSSLSSGGGNIDVNTLPNFGGGSGGGGGLAPPALRANPYEARLTSLLDNPDAIANTGAYKFALGQGQQALERSAAAKGMTGSGNTLAALLQYGQGMASQQYDKEANRLANLVQGRDQVNANLYGTDVGAATSRYGTDVGSKTSMWNTAQRINADNYWRSMEQSPSSGSGGSILSRLGVSASDQNQSNTKKDPFSGDFFNIEHKYDPHNVGNEYSFWDKRTGQTWSKGGRSGQVPENYGRNPRGW